MFILVAEGVGRYIKAKNQEWKFKGLGMWDNDLALTHWQFVGDIMIIYEETLKEERILLIIFLEFYARL